MFFLEFANVGLMPAEFQLELMRTALRALTIGALSAVGVMTLAYFLLILADPKRR